MAERNYLAATYTETTPNGNTVTKTGFQINYLTMGKKNRPGKKLKDLRAIVMHWIGPYPKQLPINTRSWWETEQAYGSAHYIIGYDGAIMQTLPMDEVGWHIGSTANDPVSKRVYTDRARELFDGKKEGGIICNQAMNNYYAIGIEMCPINEEGVFSVDTLLAAEQLVADLLMRNAAIIKATYLKSHGKDINGLVQIITNHWEVVGWKNCPKVWADYPERFVEFKRNVNKRLSMDMRCKDEDIFQEYPVKTPIALDLSKFPAVKPRV